MRFADLVSGELKSEEAASNGAGKTSADAHNGPNNHLWLDPVLAQQFVAALVEPLVQKFPARQNKIRAAAARLTADLQRLDREYRDGLAKVPNRELITFHNAFDRIADRYHLEIVARLTDIEVSPGGEVTPDHFLAAIEAIRNYHLHVIYGEPEFSAETLAVIRRETGVEVLQLDPLGGPQQPGYKTYQEMMRSNLAILIQGQSGVLPPRDEICPLKSTTLFFSTCVRLRCHRYQLNPCLGRIHTNQLAQPLIIPARSDGHANGSHAHEPHPHEPHAHDCHEHGSLAEHRAVDDALCIDHVTFAYPRQGGRTDRGLALRDVTLHVPQGCSLGIIGPNGAGKTTLLKIMLGLLTGYRGSVSLMGLSPREACRRGNVIGYVPQRHETEWRFPLTVRQVARMGLVGKTGLVRWYSRSDRDYVEQLLQELGIAELADQPIGELSGGQQQRSFMARALAARPKILVLDEPLVGIDEAGQQQFAELSRRLHRQLELTLVIVSHDLRAIATSCTQVACLNQTVHYHDSPEGLTEAVLSEVFRHEVSWALRLRDGNLESVVRRIELRFTA